MSRAVPAESSSPGSGPALKLLRTLLLGSLAGALIAVSVALVASRANGATAPATAPHAVALRASTAVNPITPGDFTGLGFDQCTAPTQSTMDRWLQNSPYLAVGIYISGDSRGCRSQPNLTPTWITTQLARGWHLLPITLGPQASCQPRFPRYGNDPTIVPTPGPKSGYGPAAKQGRAEAQKSVGVATALGITAGSTLWYDLEGFDSGNTDCRESALRFLSAWTVRLHQLGYVSGVYSSAGSGISALDQARISRPDVYVLPDQIWLARWDGKADTSTKYISNAGWQPHSRVKQFQGGHDETWGNIEINVDRDYLDLGQGTVAAPENHCGGVRISYPDYPMVRPPHGSSVPDPTLVRALKCLLQEQGDFTGNLSGQWGSGLAKAVHTWRTAKGLPDVDTFTRKAWMTLLATGKQPALKLGSGGADVTRLQRSLDSASPTVKLTVSGLFGPATDTAVRAYQTAHHLPVTGVATYATWKALQTGTL